MWPEPHRDGLVDQKPRNTWQHLSSVSLPSELQELFHYYIPTAPSFCICVVLLGEHGFRIRLQLLEPCSSLPSASQRYRLLYFLQYLGMPHSLKHFPFPVPHSRILQPIPSLPLFPPVCQHPHAELLFGFLLRVTSEQCRRGPTWATPCPRPLPWRKGRSSRIRWPAWDMSRNAFRIFASSAKLLPDTYPW